MRRDIVLCGTGGQGTVLASKVLARAAMNAGLAVKSAETIGMAQRGGSVVSHVRVGEGAASPLVGLGRADLLIAFEPAEALRQLPYLREGGALIMACLRDHAPNLTVVDAARAERELGSAKVLNVLLLGAACRTGRLGFTTDQLRQAIHESVRERFVELNDRALDWQG